MGFELILPDNFSENEEIKIILETDGHEFELDLQEGN